MLFEMQSGDSVNIICIVLQNLDKARWKKVMVVIINDIIIVVAMTVIGIVIVFSCY